MGSLKSLLRADYVQVVLDRYQSAAKLMTVSAVSRVTLWSYTWPAVRFFPPTVLVILSPSQLNLGSVDFLFPKHTWWTFWGHCDYLPMLFHYLTVLPLFVPSCSRRHKGETEKESDTKVLVNLGNLVLYARLNSICWAREWSPWSVVLFFQGERWWGQCRVCSWCGVTGTCSPPALVLAFLVGLLKHL